MVKHMKKHMKKHTKKHTKKSVKNNKTRKSMLNKKRNVKKSNKKSRMHKGGCACAMKGGSVNGPVGYAWDGGNLATWPGAAASEGANTNGMTMSNHFAVSKNGIVVGGIDPARSTKDDPITTPPMNGGKRKYKKQKGGFLQDIVNLGRGAQYGVNGAYLNLVGKQQPVSQNPYPTQDQPIDRDYKFISSPPIDVRTKYVDANENVAKV
jgi:hypothetical protein